MLKATWENAHHEGGSASTAAASHLRVHFGKLCGLPRICPSANDGSEVCQAARLIGSTELRHFWQSSTGNTEEARWGKHGEMDTSK